MILILNYVSKVGRRAHAPAVRQSGGPAVCRSVRLKFYLNTWRLLEGKQKDIVIVIVTVIILVCGQDCGALLFQLSVSDTHFFRRRLVVADVDKVGGIE